MIRTLTVMVASFALTGCATLWGNPLPQHRPDKCPAEATDKTPPEPLVSEGASIPKPRTPEQSVGLSIFLTDTAEHQDWGREGWRRVDVMRAWCNDPKRR